jgi:uncharacterized membrane protein (UPF0182 family)
VAAPDLVDENIRKYPPVSLYITPLDLQGSEVRWGEMQMVMTDDTIVYIRPLYVAGTGGSNNVPELTQVVAVNGDRIGMAPTLDKALRKVIEGAPAADTGLDPGTDTTTIPTVPGELSGQSAADLLGLATELLDSAERLQETDPDAASDLRVEAQLVLDELARLLGVAPTLPAVESDGA